MFGPTTVLLTPDGGTAPIAYATKALPLLGRRRGTLVGGELSRKGIGRHGIAVTVVTANGRRLRASGAQLVCRRVGVKTNAWTRLQKVGVGDLLLVVDDGIQGLDRVSCVVVAAGNTDPWISLRTTTGNVYAEGVLCRAS